MNLSKFFQVAVSLAMFTLSTHAQSWLTNGLVAFYPLNGNANDASGNGYNLTNFGAQSCADRFNNHDGAYYFNGTNSYMVSAATDYALPTGSADRTLSLWAKADASITNGVNHVAVDFGTGQTINSAFGLLAENGEWYVHFDGPNQAVPSNVGVDTLWHQFVCIYSFGNAQMYIDGILRTNTPWPTSTGIGELIVGNNVNGLAEFFPGAIDDIRIYNRALSASEISQLYDYEAPPQTATSLAVVTNGFVVAVDVTDSGNGYTNTPLVRVIGGGSGATAVAVVSNGVVTAINVTDAGVGYTNAPLVVIEPPFIPNPVLDIAPMSFLTFSNLTVGGIYQMQQALAWYWTNLPLSFNATNTFYTQMVAGVVQNGEYRLALNPVPAQAFATLEVVNGFVVGVTITAGGSGYVTAPAVLIVGGGGTNATAVSSISSSGTVTNITVTSAGIGYTNEPTIEIAPPPAAAVSPWIQPVMRIDSANLAPYDNYQILFTPVLGAAWQNWSGGEFSPSAITNSQFLFITNGVGFFQLQYLGVGGE